MKINFYLHSYRYFPYELAFAYRELKTLLGQEPMRDHNSLSIESANAWRAFAHRTTYFREVVADDGSRIIPLQTALETSAHNSRLLARSDVAISFNSIHSDVGSDSIISDSFEVEVPTLFPDVGLSTSLSRQSTRYSAHGLHEYKGKFNPQIVRVIGNMLGFQPGDWVLDPFCGSGTTLLEAAHIGWNAMGIDINPLGVQIAQATIAAMRIPLKELQAQTETLRQNLHERFRNKSFDTAFTNDQNQSIGGKNWQDYLPHFDYLRLWFTESVLVQLAVILEEISLIPNKDLQLIMHVVLSDILRDVSLQDPADLRIRRRKNAPENMAAITLYTEALKSKIAFILKARQYITNVVTIQEALLGDSRYPSTTIRSSSKVNNTLLFNGAITSPPYATALPYIDTQRLSLVLLGLITPEEIRTKEKSLTGNREITSRERSDIEHSIETNENHLPNECIQLCRKLKNSLDKDKDGFRRQNVPALLYKYLVDMTLMFKHTHQLLEVNAPFALVVGQNQTCLGGNTFIIDTPYLLTLLAEQNGYELQETLELNTYQRYNVHQNNSIRSETLLILRKAEYANRSNTSD